MTAKRGTGPEADQLREKVAAAVRTLLVNRVAEDWVFVGRAERDEDCFALLEITPERQDWMATLADGAEKVARELGGAGTAPPAETRPPVHEMCAIPRIHDKRGLVADGVRDGRWTDWVVLALDGRGSPLPMMVMVGDAGEPGKPGSRERADMARQLAEVARTLRGVPAQMALLADMETPGTVH